MIKDCIYCTRFQERCPKFVEILKEAQFQSPNFVSEYVREKVQDCKQFEENVL